MVTNPFTGQVINSLRRDERLLKQMADHGLIKSAAERIKILGRGELGSAKTVRAHAFSDSAAKKIQAKGGKAVVIGED